MMLTTMIVTITMMKVRTVDRHDELAVVLMCVLWIDMYRESVSASNVEQQIFSVMADDDDDNNDDDNYDDADSSDCDDNNDESENS